MLRPSDMGGCFQAGYGSAKFSQMVICQRQLAMLYGAHVTIAGKNCGNLLWLNGRFRD